MIDYRSPLQIREANARHLRVIRRLRDGDAVSAALEFFKANATNATDKGIAERALASLATYRKESMPNF